MWCLRCGTALPFRLPPGQPYCAGRELGACLDRMARLPTFPFEESVVWVDPFEEPDDLGVCSACKGQGAIQTGRQDWETGAFELLDCGLCETTGDQPVHDVPGWRPA